MQYFPVFDSVGGNVPATPDAARPGAAPPGGEPGAFLSTFAQMPQAGIRTPGTEIPLAVQLIPNAAGGQGAQTAVFVLDAAGVLPDPALPGMAAIDGVPIPSTGGPVLPVDWPAGAEPLPDGEGDPGTAPPASNGEPGETPSVPPPGAVPVLAMAIAAQGPVPAAPHPSDAAGIAVQGAGVGPAWPLSGDRRALGLQVAGAAQTPRSGAAPASGATSDALPAGSPAERRSAVEAVQPRSALVGATAADGVVAGSGTRRDPIGEGTTVPPAPPDATTRIEGEARTQAERPQAAPVTPRAGGGLSAEGALPQETRTGERRSGDGLPAAGAVPAAAGPGDPGRSDGKPALLQASLSAPSGLAGGMMPAAQSAPGQAAAAAADLPSSGPEDAASDTQTRTAAQAQLRQAAEAPPSQPAAPAPAGKEASAPPRERTVPADLPPSSSNGAPAATAPATIAPAARPADEPTALDSARTTGAAADLSAVETAPLGDAPVADRSASETGRTAPQPLDAPRPAMRAMAEALHRAADGAVELTLNPEELGRVRLTLNPGENGITVTIEADRGDTLDLMRRHADLLGNAMRELGYGEVVLDFGGKGARQGHAPQTGPAPDGTADQTAGQTRIDAPHPTRLAGGSGLDLRL
ncbi:flagellar hook-length control protein FliK [Rhodovulum euryhalinum]|nr:flagellar hook-length control protein FliK [Rhodovulum euryhalinum]